MKKILFLTMLMLSPGCQMLHKLTSSESHPPEPTPVPTQQNFPLPIITGYHPVKYEGWMPSDGQLYIQPNRPYMSTWVFVGGGWVRYLIPSAQVQYDAPTGVLKYVNFPSSAYYVFYQWLPD